MSISSIKLQLQDAGWNIKEEFLENHFKEAANFHSVVKLLLDTDLKEAGAPSLPSDVGKGKSSQIKTPTILQVTNIRNVSAPKANEESATAPRMLRLTLTDGTNYIHGLEISLIKSVSLKTAPGTKIKLHSRIPVVESYLMLSPSNTELVGGVVEELFQKWKLSESVSKYSRAAVLTNDGTGPPPWVPFGKKILAEKDRNFKAMGDPSVKKKENDDFEVQRQQVVQELSKEGSQKVFGGGKQMLDSNVQKIINSGGFTIEEAEWALKRNKNDIKKALQDLRRSQNGFEEEEEREPSYEERGRRGGRRGRGRGRGGKDNKGPDGSDDEIPHTVMARPSGPASLLDYLESRIAEKGGAELESPRREEKQEYRHPPRGRDQRGRRGRGRGRGDYYQSSSSNVYKNEPSLSVESWPTLGEEPRSNSVVAQPTVDRKTNPLSTNSSSTTYSQHNYSHSQSERSDQYSSYKDNQHSYKNYNYKSNNSTNNGGDKSYQHNSYKESNRQPSYRSEPQYLDASQGGENFGRRAEQPYYKRGMGRDLHKGSNSSIRGQTSNQSYPSQHYNQDNDFNRSESANYTSESTSYSGGNAKYVGGGGTNYGGSGGSSSYGDTSYSANRGSMNYGGNGGSANYGGRGGSGNYGGRGGNTNYGGANYGGSANYSGGTKYGVSSNYSGDANYGGSANYSGAGSRGSGNYSGRGGSANYGRGGGTNYRGSGGSSNYDSERSANYGASGGSANYDGSGGSGKVHTAKEKELIAQFEKSMVMAGCYEDSSHNSKDQSYTQGYRQEQQQPQHYDTYSQGFSGSFEFHRGGGGGGDGYPRRSRGGRRGRY